MKLANTKEKILDSALNFFSDNGYSGASIRQIARSIGIRESAIYNHYKSKEEIFLAILARYKTKNIGKAVLSDELLDEVVNPEIFLGKFALRLFEQWGKPDEIKFIRILLMEQFTKIGNKEISVADYLAETLKICELIFAEMIKNGIIKKTDPAPLAFEFISPLFLIRTEHLSADDHKSKSAAAAGVNNHISFFWNAIKID